MKVKLLNEVENILAKWALAQKEQLFPLSQCFISIQTLNLRDVSFVYLDVFIVVCYKFAEYGKCLIV